MGKRVTLPLFFVYVCRGPRSNRPKTTDIAYLLGSDLGRWPAIQSDLFDLYATSAALRADADESWSLYRSTAAAPWAPQRWRRPLRSTADGSGPAWCVRGRACPYDCLFR